MNLFSRSIILSLFLFVPFIAFSQQQQVKVKNFAQLQPLLQMDDDTIYVVNFWATWCAPCIKEVPDFEKLGEKYRNKNVKVLMVNLDTASDLQTRVIPFMEKHKMKNKVILLDDPHSNRWIPQVDKDWTGAIPATLIYGKGFREFYAQEFTFSELDEIVTSVLNN